MIFDNLSFGLALVAGLVSFLSPCVLSLVPVYLGYLGSRAVTPGGAAVASRWDTFSHGLAFVLGFSAVFVALGMTATAIGAFLFDIRGLLTRVGGVAVIVLGLHTMGLFRLGFLDVDTRVQRTPDRRLGYASSALMGVFFSAGWSPCVGPVLGAVLTLAFNADDLGRGVWLLVAYSIGLGIPFLLAAAWAGQFSAWLRRYGHLRRYAGPLAGGFLVLLGVLLLTDSLAVLAANGAVADLQVRLDEGAISLWQRLFGGGAR